MKGDSYEDFKHYEKKVFKPRFCMGCGKELGPYEHGYCAMCDKLYLERKV